MSLPRLKKARRGCGTEQNAQAWRAHTEATKLVFDFDEEPIS